MLTVLHRRQEGVHAFGEIIGESHQLTEGDLVKKSDGAEVEFAFRKEPEVPMEILFPVEEEETTQPDAGRAGADEEAGPLVEMEDREVLVVNGSEITLESSLRLLRAAAEFLGLSKGGSKQRLWRNINAKVQQQEALELFEAANKLYLEQSRPAGLSTLPLPRVPSAEEVRLHELTHLPFWSWCEHCLSCKSRGDNQTLLEDPSEGRRSVPTIELDYCFAKAESGDPILTVLVGIDTWSKMVLALPIPVKANSVKYQAEQVVRWSIHLGHHELIEIVS